MGYRRGCAKIPHLRANTSAGGTSQALQLLTSCTRTAEVFVRYGCKELFCSPAQIVLRTHPSGAVRLKVVGASDPRGMLSKGAAFRLSATCRPDADEGGVSYKISGRAQALALCVSFVSAN